MAKSVDTLEIFKGKSKWYYRVRNSNGQILLTSESYSSKHAAQNAAKALNKRHPTFEISEVVTIT